MAKKNEPTQRTAKGLEIPVPTRADWDDTLGKVIKPSPDRWQEESAEQEREYPADETNEG
jgi:hypothetical protein